MRFTILFCLFPFFLDAQHAEVAPSCTENYFKYVIGALAHDTMQGRLPGTTQEKQSAQFIAREFCKTGCPPLNKKQYCYPFEFKNADSSITKSCGNVIAKLDTKSKYIVVITAHYDHIGKGDHHSNDPFSHQIHNGADDNASGVAMLLGLAAWCNEHRKELKYDFIFAALSGEEDGLFGAQHFLNSGIVDTSKIICNINFDMVGHLDLMRPLVILDAALLFPTWDSILPVDSAATFLVQRKTNVIKGGADHCVFLERGIPAILISTGLTSHYHRPSDDIDTINFSGMVGISSYVQELILNLNRRKNLELVLQ